jgi:hypothetical protein
VIGRSYIDRLKVCVQYKDRFIHNLTTVIISALESIENYGSTNTQIFFGNGQFIRNRTPIKNILF